MISVWVFRLGHLVLHLPVTKIEEIVLDFVFNYQWLIIKYVVYPFPFQVIILYNFRTMRRILKELQSKDKLNVNGSVYGNLMFGNMRIRNVKPIKLQPLERQSLRHQSRYVSHCLHVIHASYFVENNYSFNGLS